MEKDSLHPIIDAPHRYQIIGFNLQIDIHDHLRSYIDLTLERELEIRRLRFYGPHGLEIEKGFPSPTGGMEILDVSNRQLCDSTVWVNDFEATQGAITFWAKNVIDLDEVETVGRIE